MLSLTQELNERLASRGLFFWRFVWSMGGKKQKSEVRGSTWRSFKEPGRRSRGDRGVSKAKLCGRESRLGGVYAGDTGQERIRGRRESKESRMSVFPRNAEREKKSSGTGPGRTLRAVLGIEWPWGRLRTPWLELGYCLVPFPDGWGISTANSALPVSNKRE